MRWIRISGKTRWTALCLIMGIGLVSAHLQEAACALRMVFYPVLYVSGHYSDNENQTEFDTEEEIYTTYGAALSLRFIQPTASLTLTYNPEYNDYSLDDDNTEENSLEHNASLEAHYNVSPQVIMDLSLRYDGHDDDVVDESWAHTGRFTTQLQLSENIRGEIEARYANTFDERELDGAYRESKEYGGGLVLFHRFGRANQAGLFLDYNKVDYEPPDQEENYEEYGPGASLSYWFTPFWGMDASASWERTRYDRLDLDVDTLRGDLRAIRRITPQFQVYAGYEHIYSDREAFDENLYIPSVGFDWGMTEDSGVSLGAGYLIHEWDDQRDEQFFVDADIYKQFHLTRHANLLLTAATGIDTTSEDGAELGTQVSYQAGALLSWDLLEHLSTSFRASYIRDDYIDPDVERIDNTWGGGAGLHWSPWQWATLSLSYDYENFSTDSDAREDYEEHRGTVTFQVHPVYELGRLGEAPGREEMESRIFVED